jgi:hypothetical protein
MDFSALAPEVQQEIFLKQQAENIRLHAIIEEQQRQEAKARLSTPISVIERMGEYVDLFIGNGLDDVEPTFNSCASEYCQRLRASPQYKRAINLFPKYVLVFCFDGIIQCCFCRPHCSSTSLLLGECNKLVRNYKLLLAHRATAEKVERIIPSELFASLRTFLDDVVAHVSRAPEPSPGRLERRVVAELIGIKPVYAEEDFMRIMNTVIKWLTAFIMDYQVRTSFTLVYYVSMVMLCCVCQLLFKSAAYAFIVEKHVRTTVMTIPEKKVRKAHCVLDKLKAHFDGTERLDGDVVDSAGSYGYTGTRKRRCRDDPPSDSDEDVM